MQPGNVHDPSYLPVTPDPKMQSLYRTMVAKLQFASTWVKFDIAFAVGQLALFAHWQGRATGRLSIILWNISRSTPISIWTVASILLQSLAWTDMATPNGGTVAHAGQRLVICSDTAALLFLGNLNSKRLLCCPLPRWNTIPMFCIFSDSGGHQSSLASRLHGLCTSDLHSGILGQQRMHRMEQRRDRRTRVCQAYRQECAKHIDICLAHSRVIRISKQKHFAHEAIQNGHLRLVRVDTPEQLADVFTESLQPRLHAACMAGILGRRLS